jgi:hypothetical protein
LGDKKNYLQMEPDILAFLQEGKNERSTEEWICQPLSVVFPMQAIEILRRQQIRAPFKKAHN